MNPLKLLISLFLGLTAGAFNALSSPASANEPAHVRKVGAAADRKTDRLARVDGQGVLRWVDDGGEVALFGVNYYAPCAGNWRDLQTLGVSHRQVIDQDVAHFARMGLTAIRLHVFDREISTEQGDLLDRRHPRRLARAQD